MSATGCFRILFTPIFQNRQEVIVHCVHSLIFGYWSAYWSKPRLRSMSGAGDFFRKKSSRCRDRSLQSRKCQVLFSVQATCYVPPLPHRVVGKHINKTNHNKKTYIENTCSRRKAEKKLETRNEMHMVVQNEFPIHAGQQKAVVSKEGKT